MMRERVSERWARGAARATAAAGDAVEGLLVDALAVVALVALAVVVVVRGVCSSALERAWASARRASRSPGECASAPSI